MASVNYRIDFKLSAAKELAALSTPIRGRIDEFILTLALDPRPPEARALKGQWKGLHRIRSGDYRIIYRIEDDRLIITVIKIGDRKEIYGP